VPALALAGGGLVIGIVLGLVLGTALDTLVPGAQTSPVGTSGVGQVTADNALVDRWVDLQASGSQADVEAMLRPNFRMASSNPAMAVQNPTGMWALILDGRRFNLVQARTTDVTRVGDVLFWGGSMEDPSPSAAIQDYTWTVRVDPEGRFVNAWLLFH
jgi:hypothetical protein